MVHATHAGQKGSQPTHWQEPRTQHTPSKELGCRTPSWCSAKSVGAGERGNTGCFATPVADSRAVRPTSTPWRGWRGVSRHWPPRLLGRTSWSWYPAMAKGTGEQPSRGRGVSEDTDGGRLPQPRLKLKCPRAATIGGADEAPAASPIDRPLRLKRYHTTIQALPVATGRSR